MKTDVYCLPTVVLFVSVLVLLSLLQLVGTVPDIRHLVKLCHLPILELPLTLHTLQGVSAATLRLAHLFLNH